jgi:hypothetical protein
MLLRVQLDGLYGLAEKIELLERDISVLANNAVSAANNAVERVGAPPYEPLRAACKNAMSAIGDAKRLTAGARGGLTRQMEMLREAAAMYERNDRIERMDGGRQT